MKMKKKNISFRTYLSLSIFLTISIGFEIFLNILFGLSHCGLFGGCEQLNIQSIIIASIMILIVIFSFIVIKGTLKKYRLKPSSICLSIIYILLLSKLFLKLLMIAFFSGDKFLMCTLPFVAILYIIDKKFKSDNVYSNLITLSILCTFNLLLMYIK